MNNVKDLSKTKGTYTKELNSHIREINLAFKNEELSDDDFENVIMEIIKPAYDTAAKKKFVANIQKTRERRDRRGQLIMLVSNAWLRGQGLSTNINDKFNY